MDLSGLGGKDGASDNGAGEEGDCGGCWASGSSQVYYVNPPHITHIGIKQFSGWNNSVPPILYSFYLS